MTTSTVLLKQSLHRGKIVELFKSSPKCYSVTVRYRDNSELLFEFYTHSYIEASTKYTTTGRKAQAGFI